MDRKYWEKIAPDYSEEIFDVLKNDSKGIICGAIENAAGPGKTVLDAGCAIGKWLPVLSPLFRKVVAMDISAANLKIAGAKHGNLGNIEYRRADMSSPRFRSGSFDVIVCINAILTDSLKKRNTFFHNISSSMKKRGRLVLVVPSMESWLLTRIVQHRWKIDRSLFSPSPGSREAARRYEAILQGNAEIDNVLTKHYLEEELVLVLRHEGLKTEEIQKIRYSWRTEFLKPPSWLDEPGPWDWMVVATKQ